MLNIIYNHQFYNYFILFYKTFSQYTLIYKCRKLFLLEKDIFLAGKLNLVSQI